MAQLQPVPRAPSPFGGREGPLAVLVGMALLVAIVKPWGSGSEGAVRTPFGSPTQVPSKAQASDSQAPELRAELFGPFEPNQEWSIWPAGYLTSVLYVERAPRTVVRASDGPSIVGPKGSASASTRPAPSASSPPGAEWPATIEVGPGDHLLWLGINTPRGWSLDRAVLRRTGTYGGSHVVPTRRVPTPWPDHFTAIALTSAGVEGGLAVWPAGVYSLELRVSPGSIRRILEIRIETLPDPSPEVDVRQR